MIDPHRHNGFDSPQVNAQNLIGPAVIKATFTVSARSIQPTVLQHGQYTLTAGVKFVVFPQAYSTSTNLDTIIVSETANQQFLQGIVVSGFTVSGSGGDTGRWLSMGYK